MNNDTITLAANIMQLTVALLSLIAYLPQWVKLMKTKSSRDISLPAWLLWTTSSLFAVFYAVVQVVSYGVGWALLISSLLSLGFVMFTVSLIIFYRERLQ